MKDVASRQEPFTPSVLEVVCWLAEPKRRQARRLVELSGIEPLTSSLRTRRSPN